MNKTRFTTTFNSNESSSSAIARTCKLSLSCHESLQFEEVMLAKNNLPCFCPDHMTRNDLGVEESIGESSYQFCIQWLFYFSLVSIAVKVNGPEAATRITFDGGLLFSSISGIFSLSMGQLKVLHGHKLFPTYSSKVFNIPCIYHTLKLLFKCMLCIELNYFFVCCRLTV